MMILVKFLFSLIFSALLVGAADLPPYFQKCKKSDPKLNDCILKNIVDNWQTFIQGDNKYHVQKMTPLFVPFMQVKVDNNIKGNLTNGNMIGFEQTKIKSFKMNLDKKTVEIESFWPIITLLGTYDVVGKLIGLTIADTGTTNVTFVKCTNLYFFNYQLKEKRGKQYIEILDSLVTNKDVERIYFDMKFSHNPQLGDSINEVLNENWKEVAQQVRESVGESLGGLMKALFQPFFDRISFDDLFATE